MKEKKITINKKMSLRDYMSLAYFFETGKRDFDFSECDDSALGKIEKRSMRLTLKEKEKFDEFFSTTPLGITFASLMAAVPKKKVALKPEPKVQVVYQQVPETEIPTTIPAAISVSKLGGEADEHPRPDGYVCPDISFYVDPTLPLSELNKPDNINLNTVIDLLMDDVLCEDDFWYQFGNDMYDIRGAHPSDFVFDSTNLPQRMKVMPNFWDVFDEVKCRKERIERVMSLPDPTEDEMFERYKQHVKNKYYANAIHPKMTEWALIVGSIDSVCDNKIVVEELTNKVCEYSDVESMEIDLIWLASNNIIEDNTIYDVFGKKISVDKIVKRLQKKYPDGLNEDSKLYYSEKQAYLEGALVL